MSRNDLPDWMLKKAKVRERGRPRMKAGNALPVPPKGKMPPAQRALVLSPKSKKPDPKTAPDFSHLPVKITDVVTKPWYAAIRQSGYGSGHTEYLDPTTLSWTYGGVEERIKEAGTFNQVCPAVRIVNVTLVLGKVPKEVIALNVSLQAKSARVLDEHLRKELQSNPKKGRK